MQNEGKGIRQIRAFTPVRTLRGAQGKTGRMSVCRFNKMEYFFDSVMLYNFYF